MITLEDNEKKAFADNFLEKYLDRGFGNMPKRDIDVYVFHLLKEMQLFDGLSNHLIAMKLRTTPTKVKNLIYESELRYPGEDNDFSENYFRNKLREYFLNPTYKVKEEEKNIYIQIENPVLLDSFKALAKNNKEVIDGSFSNEIVKISITGFVVIINELLTDKEREVIEEKIAESNLFEEALSFRNLSEKIFDKCLDKGIEFAPTALAAVTGWIFSGQPAALFTQIQQLFV